jgi:hypothetical protein
MIATENFGKNESIFQRGKRSSAGTLLESEQAAHKQLKIINETLTRRAPFFSTCGFFCTTPRTNVE